MRVARSWWPGWTRLHGTTHLPHTLPLLTGKHLTDDNHNLGGTGAAEYYRTQPPPPPLHGCRAVAVRWSGDCVGLCWYCSEWEHKRVHLSTAQQPSCMQSNDLDADENKCLPLHLATLMCLAMWPRSGVITWNWYWITGSRWQVIKRPLSRAELHGRARPS